MTLIDSGSLGACGRFHVSRNFAIDENCLEAKTAPDRFGPAIFEFYPAKFFHLDQRAKHSIRREYPIENPPSAIQANRLRLSQRKQAGDVINSASESRTESIADPLTRRWGSSSGNDKICARRSGLALSRDHREGSALTATEHCVRAFARSVPVLSPAQFEQLQFHCGKPPPAAEPRIWTRTTAAS